MLNRMHYIKRMPKIYFWVKYRIGNKFGILGPYSTEQDANDDAIDKLRGAASYEVVPLDTKNKSAASGKLKKVTLDETKDIGLAMQRMRRIPPSDAARQNYTPPQSSLSSQEQEKPFLLM